MFPPPPSPTAPAATEGNGYPCVVFVAAGVAIDADDDNGPGIEKDGVPREDEVIVPSPSPSPPPDFVADGDACCTNFQDFDPDEATRCLNSPTALVSACSHAWFSLYCTYGTGRESAPRREEVYDRKRLSKEEGLR